jgi:hypothetical protein
VDPSVVKPSQARVFLLRDDMCLWEQCGKKRRAAGKKLLFHEILNPAALRFFPWTSYPRIVSSRIPTTTLSQVMIWYFIGWRKRDLLIVCRNISNWSFGLTSQLLTSDSRLPTSVFWLAGTNVANQSMTWIKESAIIPRSPRQFWIIYYERVGLFSVRLYRTKTYFCDVIRIGKVKTKSGFSAI